MELTLKEELAYVNFPETSWITPSQNQFDVVIIGGGMAGLAAAYALKRLGISNFKIFDKAPKGYEGPWATTARMPTLRSGKELVGPALDFPLLTFRAWFENRFGKVRWNALGKIPTELWMEYLRWFREVLDLEVENGRTLLKIESGKQGLNLLIDEEVITTSKVVLATGRAGFGGSILPHFLENLPLACYQDANCVFDFEFLRHKKIGVIGGGASGFDAAATALEVGASHVDMILRRDELPYINKAASLTYSGYFEGHYFLSDAERWKLTDVCYRDGIPPPFEAVERIISQPNFTVKRNVEIQKARGESKVYLETSQGELIYDFIIIAAGFNIDISKQPELALFSDTIQLWSDRNSIQGLNGPRWFLSSPYLGPHFQFLEKSAKDAPCLKNIYCFNYAATLSHGLISGDIPGIGVGAMRLARGIAADFFKQNWSDYYERLLNFQTLELTQNLR